MPREQSESLTAPRRASPTETLPGGQERGAALAQSAAESRRNWTFTAVIPTFNRASLLSRAIESVLAQTRAADSIIVVDDGSTDETPAMLARYGSAVTTVRQRQVGVAGARNAGVLRSETDFVAFLDADDYWYEDHLERIAAAVGATAADSWLYFSDLSEEGESDWRNYGFQFEGSHLVEPDAGKWATLPVQPMLTSASVVRRDAYLAVGGQAENLTCREDTHFYFKLAFSGPVCAVAGMAGEKTQDDPHGSLSLTTDRLTYWRCTEWLYADILERFPDLPSSRRRILRRRLADAHLRLARLSWSGNRPAALAHLVRSVRYGPQVIAERLRHPRRVADSLRGGFTS